MRKGLVKISAVLGVVFFLYCLFLWGGVAVSAFGPALEQQASNGSPLASCYLILGRLTVGPLGLDLVSRGMAMSDFGGVLLLADPKAGVGLASLISGQSWVAKLCYYGAPILIGLAALLHFLREKPVHHGQ
ncbi:hypothetical protein [Arenimonas oryziterrae]|uniref:Uncharacterized protein n=1 Tax=Arenimonas oryziterrae DSM 21050 = YC6267 TaxID=1121015 RepID=A0A091AVP4_9GAMM|nr:hypothetical protein [Arenimonas oryziterrae]KFN43337.1 hypothetical protein N789_08670 [Arenimonas oryziterrae DSM 21050 = YC6267]